MKKLMMIAMAVCVAMAVSAQRGHGGGRGRVIVVRPSVGFGYSPFYYSPFGYSAFGYPYGAPYGYGYRRESKLDRQVEEIKSDFNDKIKSAKSDKSVPRTERKNIVRQLKADKDKAVHDAKVNYYKTPAPSPAVGG